MKSFRKILLLTCLVFALFSKTHAGVSVFMTSTTFPQSTVDISGYEGWYEVLALSLGASNEVQIGSGSNRQSATPTFQDVSISKWADSLSADLLLAVATGDQIKKIEIKTVNLAEAEFTKGGTVLNEIILEGVYVTSHSGGGVSGEDRFVENITLAWSKMTYKAYKQDKTGNSSLSKEVVLDRETGIWK